MLCPEKGWRLPDKRENTGPPEQGVTCYCFGLLLTTSGAVVSWCSHTAKKDMFMIIGIAHLFTQVKDNIAKSRNIQINGYVDSNEVSCVNNRAAQICALDILLFEHRKKYGNKFNGLKGKEALLHKLLLKYQWSLPVIRELSLSDILLALHDELQLESLPEETSRYLSQITSTQYPVNFLDYPESEWDPELSEKFLIESER